MERGKGVDGLSAAPDLRRSSRVPSALQRGPCNTLGFEVLCKTCCQTLLHEHSCP